VSVVRAIEETQGDSSRLGSQAGPLCLERQRIRWQDGGMSLLPFEEVSRRLRAAARSYRGVQAIPIERILGSVNRSDDFDREFRSRRPLSRARLEQLRRVAATGPLPAIAVFEVGGGKVGLPSHDPKPRSSSRCSMAIPSSATSSGHELDHPRR
jgi:hypothetical protein